MTPGAITVVGAWTASPGFRTLTLDEAAMWLHEIVPQYPHPIDQPVEICANGNRWFQTRAEAAADAILRASLRPHSPADTLAGPDWDAEVSCSGLWAFPGRSWPAAARAAAKSLNESTWQKAG